MLSLFRMFVKSAWHGNSYELLRGQIWEWA